MRKLSLTLLILFLASSSFAGGGATMMMVMGSPPAAGGGASYLLQEDFDGSTSCATSYSSTCTNTWTVSKQAADTVDFDNAAAPAPLGGTYSLRMTSAADVADTTTITKTISASGTVGIYFQVNLDSLGTVNNRELLAVYNGGTQLFSLFRSGAFSNLTVWDGAHSHTGSTNMDADTTYHIWVDFSKGTGANATVAVYITTTATKPGTKDIDVTDGTATLDADTIIFLTNRQTDQVLDKIRVSSSAIGSDPS